MILGFLEEGGVFLSWLALLPSLLLFFYILENSSLYFTK